MRIWTRAANSTLLLFALVACASSSPPNGYAPPYPSSPPPANGTAPSVGVNPPSGIYAVVERVVVDSCRVPRGMPAQVTMLTYTAHNQPLGSVPIPSFDGAPPKRLEVDWRGSKGNGVAVSKTCPGTETRQSYELHDASPRGFGLTLSYTLSDAQQCPNANTAPRCRVDVEYQYQLVQPACPSNCDGSAGTLNPTDAPIPPVAIQCRCP